MRAMTDAALLLGMAASIWLLAPAAAVGAEQRIAESATYVLGDNDTRAGARDICIADMERKALEESGSLVESELQMISTETPAGVNDNAQRKTKSYVGAMVKATGVQSSFQLQGDRIVVQCSGTVTFSPDEVKDRLKAEAEDEATKQEVDAQQAKINSLESEIQALRLQMAQRPAPLPVAVMQPPPPGSYESSKAQPMPATPLTFSSPAVLAARARNLMVGMDEVEVVNYVGNPAISLHEFYRVYSWNFAGVWVTMNSARVECVSTYRNPSCGPYGRLR